MSRIEQIKAEQKKLADELEGEMLKERANVVLCSFMCKCKLCA